MNAVGELVTIVWLMIASLFSPTSLPTNPSPALLPTQTLAQTQPVPAIGTTKQQVTPKSAVPTKQPEAALTTSDTLNFQVKAWGLPPTQWHILFSPANDLTCNDYVLRLFEKDSGVATSTSYLYGPIEAKNYCYLEMPMILVKGYEKCIENRVVALSLNGNIVTPRIPLTCGDKGL